MGRKGTGVEIRGRASRIRFSLNGEGVRRTLRRDGMAVPPSAETPRQGQMAKAPPERRRFDWSTATIRPEDSLRIEPQRQRPLTLR